MRSLSLAASVLALGASANNYLGFNSGAEKDDRSAKFKDDFVAEFKGAKGLKGAPGDFNAVRLYTSIQAYSEDDPIEAFEAAIETDTSILLGVWASDTNNIDREINALKKAVSKFGDDFTDRVIGISIGSEDLYRISETGIKNEAGKGNSPAAIVGFIEDFKDAFKNSALSSIPVGHVDTWDVWPNATNKPVLDAIDFVGVNSFPYYESDEGNTIKNAPRLFDRSYDIAVNAVGGKPIWITETGWPTSGPSWDEGVPSIDNAKYYWDEVGCRQLFNKVPTFWYILRDSNPDNKMKFAVAKDLTKPLFDMSCPTTFDTPTGTTTSAASSQTSGSASSPSGSASSPSPTSGSNSDPNGSDNNNNNNSSNNNDGSSESNEGEDDGEGSGAGSVKVVSAFAYAGLAVVAIVFSLL